MKTLLQFEYEGHSYQLIGSNFGKEVLLRNGEPVSQKRNLRSHGEHRFLCPTHGELSLSFNIDHATVEVQYRLSAQGHTLVEGEHSVVEFLPSFMKKWVEQPNDPALAVADQPNDSVASSSDTTVEKPQRTGMWITLGALVFKLGKSAGAMKAALAGTALAGWSWLFSLEFAVALILVLLIHEYGHIWAMRRTGLKIKGVFLVPFLGGIAVGEGTTSRWQDFKIAIAGPFVGTLGAVVFWLLWLHTGHNFLAVLTTLSLLLNLFNLLPIVPLDGGQVIKSAVLSLQVSSARAAMMVLNIGFIVLMFWLGFSLLGFFGILGLIDIAFSGKDDEEAHRPMSNTGVVVTLGSYFLLLGVLVALASFMAGTGLPGADLPLVFLRS